MNPVLILVLVRLAMMGERVAIGALSMFVGVLLVNKFTKKRKKT